MPSPLTVRRATAALAAVGATTALTLVPVTGAQAGVAATFEAQASANARFTGSGGGDCTLTSGQDQVTSSPVAFHHGTKQRTAQTSATFTNSLDSSDQVTVTSKTTSSMTLKRKAGDLASLDLSADGKITIDHTVIGSQCTGTGLALGDVPSAQFTEHHKGTLTLTFDTTKPNALIEFVVVNGKTGHIAMEYVDVATHLHGSITAHVKPGTYLVELSAVGVFAGPLNAKAATHSQRASADVALHLQFTPKKKHH